MRSFLSDSRPAIAALVYGGNIQKVKNEIAKVIEQGADIIGLMLEGYDPECRTESGMSELIDSAQGKPIYVTDYLRGNTCENITDEDLRDELMLALKLCKGKSDILVDVRGDMFDPVIGELTLNDKAIDIQMKLIKEIHDAGGKVLMSCHVLEGTSTAEHIMFIAQEQQRRGADISKIVVTAPTEEDLFKNYEVSLKLRKELDIPYIFLCVGEFSFKHRRLSGPMGSCMIFARENSLLNQTQPTIAEATDVLKCLGYYGESNG